MKQAHKTQSKPSLAPGIVCGMTESVVAGLEDTRMGRKRVSPPELDISGPCPSLPSPLALPSFPAFISTGSLAGRDRLCHTGLAAQQSSNELGHG